MNFKFNKSPINANILHFLDVAQKIILLYNDKYCRVSRVIVMELEACTKLLKNFIKSQNMPNEAFNMLSQKMAETKKIKEGKEFFAIVEDYEKTGILKIEQIIKAVNKLSQKSGENSACYYLLLAVLLTESLKKFYFEKGLSEKLLNDTVAEIKRKAFECYNSYGIWGAGLGVWFKGMFELKWFSFERLNFEMFESPYNYCKGDISVKKGDRVISVHIPSGSPLIYEECLKGYKAAAEFFSENFRINPVIFYCNSWLVFPENRRVLRKGSNILNFAADYDIVDLEIAQNGCDFGRIFGMEYTGSLEGLPANTSLQRNVLEYLKNGGTLGNGKGFFIYKK